MHLKISCLLWSSDAFWKFSPFKLYKNSGRIFLIYASKNEVVCRGIQTHSESFLPASFTGKVGAIPRFVHPKTKLFAVKFRRILEVLCLQDLQKNCGRNSTICASKNEAVFCEIQMHSGSALPVSFTGKVVGAIPQFLRPKMKLFAVKFRRILEVLYLQDLQKKLWAQFHDLCVQKRSCLLRGSDAFWKFSP